MTLRFKKRGEKALEHALRADAAQGGAMAKQKGSNPKTIPESEEPSPVVGSPQTSSVRHRRELAQVDVDGESDT
jgi:hypothetical protein